MIGNLSHSTPFGMPKMEEMGLWSCSVLPHQRFKPASNTISNRGSFLRIENAHLGLSTWLSSLLQCSTTKRSGTFVYQSEISKEYSHRGIDSSRTWLILPRAGSGPISTVMIWTSATKTCMSYLVTSYISARLSKSPSKPCIAWLTSTTTGAAYSASLRKSRLSSGAIFWGTFDSAHRHLSREYKMRQSLYVSIHPILLALDQLRGRHIICLMQMTTKPPKTSWSHPTERMPPRKRCWSLFKLSLQRPKTTVGSSQMSSLFWRSCSSRVPSFR